MKRQGDLYFLPVGSLPSEGRERQGNIILAGEITGHAHVLERGRIVDAEYGSDIYCEVPEGGSAVTHEEHNSVQLEPGIWLVRRQREHGDEGSSYVAD